VATATSGIALQVENTGLRAESSAEIDIKPRREIVAGYKLRVGTACAGRFSRDCRLLLHASRKLRSGLQLGLHAVGEVLKHGQQRADNPRPCQRVVAQVAQNAVQTARVETRLVDK